MGNVSRLIQRISRSGLLFLLTLCLGLSACWESEAPLFSESEFVNPFGSGNLYIKYTPENNIPTDMAIQDGKLWVFATLNGDNNPVAGFIPLNYKMPGSANNYFMVMGKQPDGRYKYLIALADDNGSIGMCQIGDRNNPKPISDKVKLAKVAIAALKAGEKSDKSLCRILTRYKKIPKHDQVKAMRDWQARMKMDMQQGKVDIPDIPKANNPSLSRKSTPTAKIPQKSITQSINTTPQTRGNQLTEICLEYAKMGGPVVGPEYCQCKTDIYNKLLIPADWTRATTDYVVFMAEHQGNNMNDYPSGSYEQKLEYAGGTCTGLDRGKLNVQTKTLLDEYRDIYGNLLNGDFDAISKQGAFPNFFGDFVYAYDQVCDSNFSGIERTRTSQSSSFVSPTTTKFMIKKRLYRSYDMYQTRAVYKGMGTIFKDTVQDNKTGDPRVALRKMAQFSADALAARRFLENKLSVGCYSSVVKTIDENIYRFEAGLAPINPQIASLYKRQKKAAIDKKSVAEQRRKTPIRSMLTESIARQKSIYEKSRQQEVADLSTGKNGHLKCDETRSQMGATDYDTYAGNAEEREFTREQLGNKMHGAWAGVLDGTPIEIVFWEEEHKNLGGLTYIPDANCMMTLNVGSNSHIQGHATSVMIWASTLSSPNDRRNALPKYCSIPKKFGPHGAYLAGYVNVDAGQIEWRVFEARLGERTPKSCQGGILVLKRAKLSPDFSTKLDEYAVIDQRYKSDQYYSSFARLLPSAGDVRRLK